MPITANTVEGILFSESNIVRAGFNDPVTLVKNVFLFAVLDDRRDTVRIYGQRIPPTPLRLSFFNNPNAFVIFSYLPPHAREMLFFEDGPNNIRIRICSYLMEFLPKGNIFECGRTGRGVAGERGKGEVNSVEEGDEF
jgi:hypothetical protein